VFSECRWRSPLAHCSPRPGNTTSFFKSIANMKYLVCTAVCSHLVRTLYHTDCKYGKVFVWKLLNSVCIPYRSQLKTSICVIQGVSCDTAHSTSTDGLNILLLSRFTFPCYKKNHCVIWFLHSIQITCT
jgi:hypothetical protein